MRLENVFTINEKGVSTLLIIIFSLLAWMLLFSVDISQSDKWAFISYENICGLAGIPELETISYFPIFLIAWTVMILAMMLPSLIPLINHYQSFRRNNSSKTALVVLLVLSYITVWIVFGLGAYLFKIMLLRFTSYQDSFSSALILINSSLFFLAGLYQFSPFRNRCIRECRYSEQFIVNNWKRNNVYFNTVWVGILHGIYCIGCFWILMFLMFSISTVNIQFMIILGIIMVVEKNVHWGRKITNPLGIIFIATSIIFLFSFYSSI